MPLHPDFWNASSFRFLPSQLFLSPVISIFSPYNFLRIFWERWAETTRLVKSSVFLSVLTLLDLFITSYTTLFGYSSGFSVVDKIPPWDLFPMSLDFYPQLVLFFPLDDLIRAHRFSFLSCYLNALVNWLPLFFTFHNGITIYHPPKKLTRTSKYCILFLCHTHT